MLYQPVTPKICAACSQHYSAVPNTVSYAKLYVTSKQMIYFAYYNELNYLYDTDDDDDE